MDLSLLIVHVVVPLIVVGVLLWALEAVPGIDAGIKRIIRIIVIVCVVLWLLLGVLVPMLDGASWAGYHHRL